MREAYQIVIARSKGGDDHKFFRSPDYNYRLNLKTGSFARWGKTEDEDPQRSPFGPEILDCEVTTICAGGCPYCYKSNTAVGENMTFETFEAIVEKVNEHDVLTQVAFGLGMRGDENPDLWRMCEYLRRRGIMPNGTIANGTSESWDKIARYFGACAVSYHGHWANAMGTLIQNVYELGERGMDQVNVHFVLCRETVPDLYELFHQAKTNPMLRHLNAIVLLGLKRKGRGENGFTPLSTSEFEEIASIAVENDIRFGFDSCDGSKFMAVLEAWRSAGEIDDGEYSRMKESVEPCESFSCFSSYVDVHGEYWPCSFCEGIGEGVKVTDCGSFVDEVWNGERMLGLHEKSIENERRCLYYEV
jgi:hypothetical protein